MPRQPHPAAVATARQLLDKYQIRKPSELDVELIANDQGLLVRRRSLRLEEGRLVRAGSYGVVSVSSVAYQSNKWRFVVAHELGHFMRHEASDSFAACTDGDLSDYHGSGREAEANDFAAELLMPAHLFAKACDRNRPSLKDIGEIATLYQTSLSSTALRFVQFTDEPCAVVCSVDGEISWLDWSKTFRLGIKKRTRLTQRTYAGDLFAGKDVRDFQQSVDSGGWSDNPWGDRIDLYEHSRRVAHNAVLSFLWHRS